MTKCLTCKRRKVRCDAAFPSCSACVRLNLFCHRANMDKVLTWLPPTIYHTEGIVAAQRKQESLREDVSQRGRQVFFRDAEQMATSNLVQQALGGVEVDRICDDLDRSVHNHNPLSSIGLFSLIVPKHSKEPLLSDSTPRHDELLDLDQWPASQFPTSISSHATTNQGLPSLAPLDRFRDATFQDDNQLPSAYESVDEHIFVQQLLPSTIAASSSETILLADNRQTPPPDGFGLVPSPSSFANALPDTTYFLLDHYKTNMLASFSPKHNPYPPWKVLHLPSALQAVSEISIWGSGDHIRTSLLYSILALCAFNLDASSNPELDSTTFWSLKAISFCQIAQEQLRLGTASNADEQCQGRIDELVIATMSMNTISVMSGKANQARNFLLAAERMIERRAVFENRQCREFKMLCNMLLYTRVMEEVTHIYPAWQCQSNLSSIRSWSNCSATEETLRASHEARFPSLRTRVFIETKDLKALRPAGLESYLNNEIQAPQRHLNSTFDDIFGLPESLISLISRTTHAINIIEADFTDLPGLMNMDAIRTLERDIIEAAPDELSPTEANKELSTENNKDLSFQITNAAVHTALSIYFYREIRYVHPTSIQHFVDKTLLHLLQYEKQTKDCANFAAAGICWAAFVIGCEATELSSREQILQLISRLADKSGNGNFRTALKFVPVVWESRTEAKSFDLSWRQVLRASKLELLLS